MNEDMNTAKQVREKKLLRPNDYCLHPLCLFRTQTRDGFKPCPTHGVVSRLLGVRELPERSATPTAPVSPLTREELLKATDHRGCECHKCKLAF